MKYTAEQHFFTFADRRAELLKRRTILTLFSIITAPDTDVSSRVKNTYAVTATNGQNIFDIPQSFTPPASVPIGKVINTHQPMSEHDTNLALSSYNIVQINKNNYAVEVFDYFDKSLNQGNLSLICLGPSDVAPYKFKAPLIVRPNDIENYREGQPFISTYGRYFVNYFLLASIFGQGQDLFDEFKYVNSQWNIGKVETGISHLLMEKKITPKMVDQYIDHGYFLSSFGEICGATLTKKAIVPNQDIIKRRDELLEKHKNDLKDPRIMAIVENELIAMDKAYLKDDPSMDFFGDTGKKFTIHRKRQFVSVGLVEEFSKEKGKYEYISKSLSEGWTPQAFPMIMDETRKGFYDRAVETEIAGLDTKLMGSVFQGCTIVAEDCGSTGYLTVTLTKDTAKQFLGQWVKDGKDLVELTRENMNSYLDKPIQIRSIMYCKQKDGFCRKCAGEYFKNLDFNNIGMQTIDVGAVFLYISMKSMHGTKIETMPLESLDKYCLNP